MIRFGRTATLALALVLATVAAAAAPTSTAAASLPRHYVDGAWCWGAGDPLATTNQIEVWRPVIYAFDRHSGATDWQKVQWKADLQVWNGSAWQLDTSGQWSAEYWTPDGEGWAPQFDPAILNYNPLGQFNIRRLSLYYRVVVTVRWLAVENVPTVETSFLPQAFFEPSGGYWLASQGLYCNYTPKVGYVRLPS